MSAQYARSLRYQIEQCDFLLETVGWPNHQQHTEDEQQNAVDFLYNLKLGYRAELEAL